MKGVKAGETREGEAKLSDDAPNESLRGKTIKAAFEVLEVKKLELPQLTPALLEELGGFEIRSRAARSGARSSSSAACNTSSSSGPASRCWPRLTVAADWDLPPEMLRRQARRELERSVLELRRSGFSDDEIRASRKRIAAEQQRRPRPGP